MIELTFEDLARIRRRMPFKGIQIIGHRALVDPDPNATYRGRLVRRRKRRLRKKLTKLYGPFVVPSKTFYLIDFNRLPTTLVGSPGIAIYCHPRLKPEVARRLNEELAQRFADSFLGVPRVVL